MSAPKSKAALLDFLDYLARKGLMNKTTASSRKAAANNVLSILDDDEAADVSILDIDDVMRRFNNLNGMKYTSDSLSTYKSRVKSAIDDFVSYVDNPMAFKPSVGASGRKSVDRSRGPDSRSQNNETSSRTSTPAQDFKMPPPVASMVLPIPIRADLTVYVQGLPYNLTQSEASKIANVVRAMVAEE
jgi:hypothetical protein